MFSGDPKGSAFSGESILEMTPDALAAFVDEMGEPRFRAKQILEWIYHRDATSWDEMTNLPAALRRRLGERLRLYESEIQRDLRSSDGTQKLLLRWSDDATTECVLIPDGDRRTACISTQVGCPVGCVFCASGIDGLQRHLSAAQIVEQAMRVRRLCAEPDHGARLTNVVFMGLGEPLHNYDATLAAIRIINANWGMNIGARRITLSTVGLPKQIKRLAAEGLQINLAVSLHAPDDELRKRLIPWAESIDIESLVEAITHFFDLTGREVTLEYVLLNSLNDQPQHARKLASLAKRMRCNINLIRFNPVDGLPFARPTAEATERFQRILRQHGANSHVRKSRGRDIDGACGQLRRRSEA